MAAYADLDAVRLDLDTTPSAEEDERLAALNAALSAQFEEAVGRSWEGGGTATEQVVVPAPGVSDVLVLPKRLRTVASVVTGAAWDGAAWADGTTLDPDGYRLVWQDRHGDALGIVATNGGSWSGPVVVTGTWADSPADAVPADVVEALNYLVASFWLRRKESPEGLVGPDGLTVPRRYDPWKDPRVVRAIERHRAASLVVV